MFDSGFDLGMSVILLGLSFIFLLGFGGGLLEMFSGGMKQIKRTKEQEKRYQRAIGLLLLLLGILQALLYLTSNPFVPVICLLLAIAGLVAFVIYLRHIS